MNLIESIEIVEGENFTKEFGLGEFRDVESDRVRAILFAGDKERYEVLVASAIAMDHKSAMPIINKFESNQHNYIAAIEEVYKRVTSLEYYNSLSLEMMYKVTVVLALAQYQSGGDYQKKKQFYMGSLSKDYERHIKVMKEQCSRGQYSYEEFIQHTRKNSGVSAAKCVCDAAIYFYFKECEPFENEGHGLAFPFHLLVTDFSNVVSMLHRDTYLMCRDGLMKVDKNILEEVKETLERFNVGKWKLKQKMNFYQLFEKFFIQVRMIAVIEHKEEVQLGYMIGNSESAVSLGPCRFLGCEMKYSEFVYVYLLAKEWVTLSETETPSRPVHIAEGILVSLVRVMERQQKIEQNKDYLVYRLMGKYQGVESEMKTFQKEKARALEAAQKSSLEERIKWEREIGRTKLELQNVKQELKVAIENSKAVKRTEEEREETERMLKEELASLKSEREYLLRINGEYAAQLEALLEDEDIELPSKVVFITGHPNLRNNVKERFGWETVDIDKLNDMTKISGADLILYNSYSNNHTIFRKLKAEDLEKVVYTHGGTNLDVLETLAKNGWKNKMLQGTEAVK